MRESAFFRTFRHQLSNQMKHNTLYITNALLIQRTNATLMEELELAGLEANGFEFFDNAIYFAFLAHSVHRAFNAL